jgi:hypothetical protein
VLRFKSLAPYSCTRVVCQEIAEFFGSRESKEHFDNTLHSIQVLAYDKTTKFSQQEQISVRKV